MAMSKGGKVAIGAGVLIGGFFAFHEIRKWLARRRIENAIAAAANGQISTTQALQVILANGVPSPDGKTVVTVADAKRMSCDQVFPPGVATLPEFQAAIAELRRQGTCL